MAWTDEDLTKWRGDEYPPPIEAIAQRIDTEPQWRTVSVEQGWWPILIRLDEKLRVLDPNYRLRKIKADMARLDVTLQRPVCADVAEQMYAAVREAEDASWVTCEKCGQPGTVRTQPSGWMAVLCDDDGLEP